MISNLYAFRRHKGAWLPTPEIVEIWGVGQGGAICYLTLSNRDDRGNLIPQETCVDAVKLHSGGDIAFFGRHRREMAWVSFTPTLPSHLKPTKLNPKPTRRSRACSQVPRLIDRRAMKGVSR